MTSFPCTCLCAPPLPGISLRALGQRAGRARGGRCRIAGRGKVRQRCERSTACCSSQVGTPYNRGPGARADVCGFEQDPLRSQCRSAREDMLPCFRDDG